MDEARPTTEVPEESPYTAAAKPETKPPSLDTAVQQTLAMIASQGMEFGGMDMSLTASDATLVLRFKREG